MDRLSEGGEGNGRMKGEKKSRTKKVQSKPGVGLEKAGKEGYGLASANRVVEESEKGIEGGKKVGVKKKEEDAMRGVAHREAEVSRVLRTFEGRRTVLSVV